MECTRHATVCTLHVFALLLFTVEILQSISNRVILCIYKWLDAIRVMCKWNAVNLPGNFLVLKDAFVIIDLEMETTDGVMATLMPIGPSHG